MDLIQDMQSIDRANLRRLLVICGTAVHNNKKKSEQLCFINSINQDQLGSNCELKMIHQ